MNGLDKAGSIPLHWAAHGGHVDCMNALLENPRCEINVQVRWQQSQQVLVGEKKEISFHVHRN